MPNCFVPYHEFRSLTSCTHTRTHIYLQMQRQMCAATQKWAQVYNTQITASSGKGHHDDDSNNNCASYHSNGLRLCAKHKNENRIGKGYSGNVSGPSNKSWTACENLAAGIQQTEQPLRPLCLSEIEAGSIKGARRSELKGDREMSEEITVVSQDDKIELKEQ